jgi:hypothetical protein
LLYVAPLAVARLEWEFLKSVFCLAILFVRADGKIEDFGFRGGL